MAGIDNIVNQILQEAKEKGDALIAQGQEKADELLAQAKEAGEKLAEESARSAKKSVRDLEERAKSQAALKRRQTLLQAKQEIIDEVIEKAYKRLETQDDAAYFGMAATLLEKAVRSGEGTIFFNAEDLKRIPADFAKKVQEIAAAKNGTLTISDTPAKIHSGLILSYGGIEENCSLEAIFAEKKDALRDLVNGILW